jgi:hypothetical protein
MPQSAARLRRTRSRPGRALFAAAGARADGLPELVRQRPVLILGEQAVPDDDQDVERRPK